MVEVVCDKCNGKGWLMKFNSIVTPYKKTCPKCEGSGYVLKKVHSGEQTSRK